jgi:hypothetical protein
VLVVTLLLYFTQLATTAPTTETSELHLHYTPLPGNKVLPRPHLFTLRATPPERSGTFEAYEVTCGYQISGPYNKLQRFLFYAVSIVVFCFRFHKWLTVVGVGFLLTYTTTAAIHGLILVCIQDGADLDFLATKQIVTVASVTATNLMFFAPRIFRTHLRGTFIGWSIVLYTVYLLQLILAWNFLDNHIRHTALEVCHEDGNCMNSCNIHMQSTMVRSNRESKVPVLVLSSVNIPYNNSRNVLS